MSYLSRFYVKRIVSGNIAMANICDANLLNKSVCEGGLVIHFSPEYFGEEEVGLDEALRIVEEMPILNLAGNEIVERVIEAKLASARAVREIGSVKFLMVFKFRHTERSGKGASPSSK